MNTFKESQKLTDLKLSVAKVFSKADGMEDGPEMEEGPDMKDVLENLMSYCSYLKSSMYEQSYAMQNKMMEHGQGHLPKLTAGAMKKLLKTCGMDEDYRVEEKVIYAQDNSFSATIK